MSDVLHHRQETLGLEEHALSVFVVPPLWEPAELFRRAGLPIRKNVKRVGVWFWELEDVPKAWIKNSKFFDEIWAPSRFIGESLRKVLPVPVIDMPQSLRVQPFEPVPREMYGLKPGETVFLFVFDAASSVERKNPAGLVRAFQQAFPRTREARLVIKVSRPQAEPRNMAKLRQMVAGDPRILLVERTMSRHELLGLMDAADCYVSLHRAEGLGLTMAEAALLAKPVITTAYSGVLDFLNDKTALMVGHSMTTITHDRPPFQKGWRWADPDLAEAANHMRWVRAQPLLARQIGLRAKESVAKALDPAKQGQWIADQLHRLIPGFRKYAA
jgi:glycosyltransferase involved in cell wall biosynthesis